MDDETKLVVGRLESAAREAGTLARKALDEVERIKQRALIDGFVIKGDKGDSIQGEKGEKGERGESLLSGRGPPGTETGCSGDIYVDTKAWAVYGPKKESWGSPIPLVGPPGKDAKGSPGLDGQAGRSVKIFEQTAEPVDAEPGDIWVKV